MRHKLKLKFATSVIILAIITALAHFFDGLRHYFITPNDLYKVQALNMELQYLIPGTLHFLLIFANIVIAIKSIYSKKWSIAYLLMSALVFIVALIRIDIIFVALYAVILIITYENIKDAEIKGNVRPDLYND